MKKLILVLIFIISLTFVYAEINISLTKETLAPHETLQASITLVKKPLIDVSVQNFYIDNTKIPVILTKLNELNYFAYTPLNLKSGIHTLQLKLIYLENNVLEERIFEKEFYIQDSNSYVTIDPALVVINKEDIAPYFKIYLTNKGTESIELGITSQQPFIYPSKTTLSIPSGEQRSFFLYTKSSEEKETTQIQITNQAQSYSIPVIVINKQQAVTENKTAIIELNNKTTIVTIDNDTAKIDIGGKTKTITLENETAVIASGEIPQITVEQSRNLSNLIRNKITFNVTTKSFVNSIYQAQTPELFIGYYNSFENPIQDITFELSDSLKEIITTDPQHLDIINSGELNDLHVLINQEKTAELKKYEGTLTLKARGIEQDSFYFYINVLPKKEDVNEQIRNQTIPYEDLATEDPLEDNPIFNYSKNLVEEGSKKTKTKNKTLLIVLGVIAVIILIAYLLINKQKPKNFKDYLDGSKK